MIQHVEKRFLALLLTFIMVISLVPFDASAAEVTVLDGKITVTDTAGNVSVNGNTVTASAAAESYTDCGQTKWRSTSNTVTFKNTSGAETIVKFNYTISGAGSATLDGTAATSGTYSQTMAADATATFVLTSGEAEGNTITLSLTGIEVVENSARTLTFPKVTSGGTATAGGTELSTLADNTVHTVSASFAEGVAVTATPASGYTFLAWVDSNSNILSTTANTTLKPTADATVSPIFVQNSSTQGWWKTSGKLFSDLNDAAAAAVTGDGVVVLLKDATLPAGNYVIPEGVTVLIPFDAAHTLYTDSPEFNADAWVKPTPYVTLTMAKGANMYVNGALSLSAKHYPVTTNKAGGALPHGKYGYIKMAAGSNINVTGQLYCWGFISGDGVVTAESGAAVYENMQFTDLRGGQATLTLASTNIFPMAQYYVQNIETKLILKPGSREYAVSTVDISGSRTTAAVNFIAPAGNGAMFGTGSNTTVTKDYDPSTDRLNITASGDLSVDSLELKLNMTLINSINSATFVLPITNNISVELLSGTTTVNQDLSLLPGAEFKVGKNAILMISSGTEVYVYDSAEYVGKGYLYPSKDLIPSAYSPTRTYNRTAADLKDAVVDINGVVAVQGELYTTSGGAALISSEDTGMVVFMANAGTKTAVKNCTQSGNQITQVDVPITAAQLLNGDNTTYVATAGTTSTNGFAYSAAEDKWVNGGTTIIFDPNGGTGNPYSVSVPMGSIIQQQGNSATVPDASNLGISNDTAFVNWNTASDSSGTTYNAGDTLVVTQVATTITLYAMWEHDCVDADHNHKCDKCSAEMGTHADSADDKDHVCDYGCGEVLEECTVVTDAAVAPDCINTGLTEGSHCSVCGDVKVKQEIVDALGHTDGTPVKENEKAPTCGAEGSYDSVVYCTVCKAEVSRKTEIVPATGNHNYTKETERVEATCTVDGYVIKKCDCGATEKTTLKAPGHKAGEPVKENEKAPTCDEEGSYDTVAYCTVCGAEQSRVTTTISATGHDMQETAAKVEATCEEDGKEAVYTCANGCGKTEGGDVIPATGHGEDVTYTYTDDNHSATYDCCGAAYVTNEPHTYVEGICVCGKKGTYTITFKQDPDFAYDDNFAYSITKNYGEAITEKDLAELKAALGTYYGYEFQYWMTEDGEYTIPATMPAYDQEVTAYWDPLRIELTVYSSLNPTQQLGNKTWMCYDERYQTVEQFNEINYFNYTDPNGEDEYLTPEGYVFVGYKYEDGTDMVFPYTQTLLEDMNIYAQFAPKSYTLTFKDSDGNNLSETEVEYGAAITYPDTEKEGYTFNGWDCAADTMPASDLTITGTWTVNSYSLLIRVGEFVGEYGLSFEFINVQVPYGALVKDYLPETPAILVNSSTYQGIYVFDYWWLFADSMNGVDVETFTMPANDETITASYLYTGWIVEEGGKQFVSNQNPQHNWFCVNDNNELVTDGSGDWYYGDVFNDCYIVTGVNRVWYPTEAINGITYAPDQESVDYYASKGQTFIDAAEAWFVFDEDGKFQSDLTGIGTYMGETRYVENGMLPWNPGLVQDGEDYYYFLGDTEIGGNIMATGNVYMSRNNTDLNVVVSGVYTYGADGKLLKADGITDVNGTLYYYEDYRLMIGAGLIEVDGDYYYVRSNGALVVNSEYWVGANEFGIVEGTYEFDENGKLVLPEYEEKNGVYAEDGGLFYYVNGKRTYAGLIQWNGGWIYVRSNGQLAVGRYWTTKHNDAKPEGFYEFDENGMMIEIKDGIINENGTLYYYINNVKQYNSGVIQLNGNYYYVRSNGVVVANQSYWITNVGNSGIVAKQYTFDANGVMQNPEFAVNQKEGVVDGYYYENGKIVYAAGLIVWKGDYYYVRSNGQIATGEYWITTTNGLMDQGKYNFGTDGKMILN